MWIEVGHWRWCETKVILTPSRDVALGEWKRGFHLSSSKFPRSRLDIRASTYTIVSWACPFFATLYRIKALSYVRHCSHERTDGRCATGSCHEFGRAAQRQEFRVNFGYLLPLSNVMHVQVI